MAFLVSCRYADLMRLMTLPSASLKDAISLLPPTELYGRHRSSPTSIRGTALTVGFPLYCRAPVQPALCYCWPILS